MATSSHWALPRLLLCVSAWLCCARTHCDAHGTYHGDVVRLDEQVKVSPDDGSLLFERARISFLHGDWQICLANLERSERLMPERYSFDYLRGQAFDSGGQFAAAKTVLDGFVTVRPAHGPAIVLRAGVEEKLGHPTEALDNFRASLFKKPEPDLYLDVVEALKAAGLNDEALAVLERGMAWLGTVPSLALKALDMETTAGRSDAARRRVEQMQKLAPRPEPWMAKRAELLAGAGRKTEARQAWAGLRERIAAMPGLERGSVAMTRLAELAALTPLFQDNKPQSTPRHTPSL